MENKYSVEMKQEGRGEVLLSRKGRLSKDEREKHKC